MSRLAATLVVASLAAPAFAHAEDAPKVLLIVRDGARDLELMLTEEVAVMKKMLEESGFDVVVATESGEPIRKGSAELTPDAKVSEISPSSYAGVALPCMAPAPGHPLSAESQAVVRSFVDEGKPILAARGSVADVAKAGGLEGKDYAFASEVDVKERPEFKGGRFHGTGVVRDGNVSTSGICPLSSRSLNLPDGTEEVTRRFIESLRSER